MKSREDRREMLRKIADKRGQAAADRIKSDALKMFEARKRLNQQRS